MEDNGFSVESFTDPAKALLSFGSDDFDVVLSDFYMPEMNGDAFLKEIRAKNADCAFLFLAADSNLKQAIELIQQGADDYIVKPVVVHDLIFRVRRSLAAIRRRQSETNWQQLYAAKDIRQTEKMIDQLSKAINQTGGYLWLDLLKEELQHPHDGKYTVSTEIGDMVLETAEVQKQILEYITLIADTNRFKLDPETVPIETMIQSCVDFCRRRLETELADFERPLSIGTPRIYPDGMITVDMQSVYDVLNELLINAIKFSPARSRIVLSADLQTVGTHSQLAITLQNTAQRGSLTDEKGELAVGIPANYTETVFDLFFSTDDFHTPLPLEKWPNGAGLYIARKIMKRQNGWLRTGTGTDHTAEQAVPVVRFTIILPVLPV